MYAMHAAAVVCSSAPTSRVTKTLKEAEARRLARMKTLGRRVVTSLKQLDREAREVFVQDVRDLAATASEVAAQALDQADAPPPAADS